MADVLVPPLAVTNEITVPAAAQVAVWSRGAYVIRQVSASVNYPDTTAPIKIAAAGIAQFQTGVLDASNATTITIENLSAFDSLFYSIGTDATVLSGTQRANGVQIAPGVLNATGALTSAMILAGIVTSTTAAAVAATLPTGTVLDAATTMAINDYFDWAVIATGANAFTVTAATGHTVVGGSGAAIVVPTLSSALMRTRKTAANTFITYAISNPVS